MTDAPTCHIDPVALREDFNTLCDFGGRFAGTPGELSARGFVTERLAETGAHNATRTYPYDGWRRISSSVALAERPHDVLDSTSLVLSNATPPAGMEIELVDLGRGTPEDFAAQRERIAGRAVLVRHEFPFTVRHVHRRRKYGWAKAAGARAFLIANHLPGVGVVSGSSGRGDADDIVSVGISHEAGLALARAAHPAIRLRVESERVPMQGAHVLFEMPGQTDEWVVLCAHLDGHDLAESALDNATGVAAVLAIARALAPGAAAQRRGLRVMLFTFEEWGLYGSSLYVNGLSPQERAKISFVVNLDTIVGSPRLSALISEMNDVGDFIAHTTAGAALPVDLVQPVLGNSDHYNFFLGGIPSFRLIAGYEDENAATRFLLTPADTRALVDLAQLAVSTAIAGTIALAACAHDGPIARHRTTAEVASYLDPTDPWVADRISTK
ncbi:MAG: M28 family metallopeptidase [Candidatus Velthaea sp.]